jgi:hypothetical protein
MPQTKKGISHRFIINGSIAHLIILSLLSHHSRYLILNKNPEK